MEVSLQCHALAVLTQGKNAITQGLRVGQHDSEKTKISWPETRIIQPVAYSPYWLRHASPAQVYEQR
jgi:hypothetical protein